jgi:DNA (cytosine-5)-methyltransferase 1
MVNMNTIDLFAGCGGIYQGMESAGFRTVFANDINPDCKPTWDLNFDTELTIKDLNAIEHTDLPDFDCLTGGFPCQPFSVSGKGLGFQDTRGTLFFKIAELLHYKRPQTFLLENVKQLYHHDGGNTFQTILRVLREDLGYDVHYKILNSLNYGVPQNRERVFIVGFNKPTDFQFPEPVELTTSVKNILEDDVDERFFYREDHKHYKAIAAGVTDPDKVYQWRWSYIRENKKNVCPTILASNMQPTLILTKQGIRTITPLEGFRLQGFPDTFKIPDLSDRKLFHQIGNSVTVPVINAIARNIRVHTT